MLMDQPVINWILRELITNLLLRVLRFGLLQIKSVDIFIQNKPLLPTGLCIEAFAYIFKFIKDIY